MNNNFENQNTPLRFRNRPPKFIHSESELNNFIKLTILEWSENDFTCPYAIQTFISQVIEPAQMKAYFAQCYNNIHTMKEHIHFIQSINSHIWALFSCRPAVTFYDVYKLIEALCTPSNRSTIGPLTKIPIVKALIFNHIEVRTRTPEIRLSDLILDCAAFINEKCNPVSSSHSNKSDRWNLIISHKSEELTVNSLSEKQFLHYLKVKYSVNDFNLLGVKITNFKALKEAAYAAKCESFHLLVNSDKLMRLLRPDMKQAMKNVREKLAQSKLFKLCNKSADVVKQFAELPFQESIKQAFDTILNEQLWVASKHGLPVEVASNEKYLAEAAAAARFLSENELHGGIFQLAAVGAGLVQSQAAANHDGDDDTFERLIRAPTEQWRCRIFVPLMEDINHFLHSSLSRPDLARPDSTGAHRRIITRCKAISHLFRPDSVGTADTAAQFHASRLHLLTDLAACATSIVHRFPTSSCIATGKQLAQLQLDLLPQAYILLVSLLSRCQLLKQPSVPPDGRLSVTHNSDLIQSLFKAKCIDLIMTQRIKDGKFPFETVAELEKQMLEALGAPSWPLEGSFIDYFIGNRGALDELMKMMSPQSDGHDREGDNAAAAACQCVPMHREFITHLIKTAPKQITMETFMCQTLQGRHGMGQLISESCRKSISAIWNSQEIRQSHLMEDGAAPAIDLRMGSRGAPAGASGNAEWVMQAISRVPLMEDAASHLRWDALYHAFWGHIAPFVNEHHGLAAALNVRLLISAVGTIRITARCCPLHLIDPHVTAMATATDAPAGCTASAKQFLGNILSLFITDSLSSSLPICHLINRLANLINSSPDFIRFSVAVIDCTPPELLVAMVTHLLYPLSGRVCEPADVSRTLQSILALSRQSSAVVMPLLRAQLCQLSSHPVADIIRCVEEARVPDIATDIHRAVPTTPVEPITKPTNQLSQPQEEYAEEPAERLVIDTSACPGENAHQEQHNQAIVDDIRRNEFGIGLVTNDNSTSQVMDRFNAKMARLVEHLSSDLYANGSHFILELIQNADDNAYSGQVTPQLELIWRAEGAALVLDVINNESGFMESDLRALCDIGCSTKSKCRNNKIGRKGIGFKSVFLVSERPEVHSNGFHVAFDRYRVNEANEKVSNNALVPSWCGAPSPAAAAMPAAAATLIRLPIIPALANHIQPAVALQLKPHLLLFLRNLTRISVTGLGDDGQQQQRFIELVRHECTANHRAIRCHDGQQHHWFMRTQQIPILEPDMLRISPRGLTVTELSIAIPLAPEQQEEEDCPTFAFLPIRSYGLRFIINADFSIPASREDISNACPWNRWLIEQAARVFTACVIEYAGQSSPSNQTSQSSPANQTSQSSPANQTNQSSPANQTSQSSPANQTNQSSPANQTSQSSPANHAVPNQKVANTIRIIKCIPLPGEVPTDSAFHILIPMIRSQLIQLNWLPDRSGQLHSPCQLIVESVDDIKLTGALCNRLNLTLLHPAIASSGDERVTRALDWLGCQALSLQHLGKLLSALLPLDIADPALMRSVIAAIHAGLERDQSMVTSNRLLAQLAAMPIWPVMTQSAGAPRRFVSISQSGLPPIFLPSPHWSAASSNNDNPAVPHDPYSCLRLVISPAFIASFKSPANHQQHQHRHGNAASSILQRLGVHELSSATMIDHAIMPQLQSNNHCPGRDWLVAASQFLVEHCHSSQYRDRVLPLLSFATVSYDRDGQSHLTVTPHRELHTVHLPNQMLVTMTTSVLPLLHGRVEYTVLDDAYLDCCSIQPTQWREFLSTATGISETFYSIHSNDISNNKESQEYPEVTALLSLNDKQLNVDLLRYLDINWNQLSAPRYHGLVENFLACPSIPVCASYEALNQSDQLLDLSLPLRRPTEALFLCSGNPNKALLPDSLLAHFPICPVQFSSISLPCRLGMIDEVNANHILALLRRVFIDKSLAFTGKQAIDFYNWIKQNLSSISLMNLISELRSLLGGATLVAVPNGEANGEECELLIGQSCYWTLPISEVSTKHIFIQDQQVSEDLKQLLSAHWCYRNPGDSCPLVNVFPGLKELFVDIMGIREFPSVQEVWGALERLLQLLGSERLKDLNNAELELITDVYNLVRFLDSQGDQGDLGGTRQGPAISELPLLPCLSGNYRPFISTKRPISIYSWRSYETVHAFQQQLHESGQGGPDCPIDFLSVPLGKREGPGRHASGTSSRWTAAQFITNYFQPPVLEDEMRCHVDNREAFSECSQVKLMLHHLEAIVHEWFTRNMPKDATALCMNKLSSLTSFRNSADDVMISVRLRSEASIRYRYSDKVYIGAIGDGGAFCHELLLGGFDLHLERLVAMGTVMEALIAWILDGDRYNHFRERFRKFYRSLFDLIETSDDNQVSIFIRSHNLRVNPCSIDYIFAAVRSVKEEEEPEEEEQQQHQGLTNNSSPAEPSSPGPISPVTDISAKSNCLPAVTIATDATNRNLKRKRISISIENVIPAKQICLSDRSKQEEQEESVEIAAAEQIELPAHDNQSDDPSVGTANGAAAAAIQTTENRKLKVRAAQPVNEPITINSDIDIDTTPGQISPLSMRLKEQMDSQKDVRLSMIGLAPDNMAQMSGRIGEQLAYQKLTANQRLGEWEILRVDWLNQHRESRLPYDFKISARRSDSSVADKIYLEVKATTQPTKLQFDLSPQEVTAAWSFKEHYHLLLVFHSGSYPDTNTRFIHIPDTLGQLQDNQCKLLLDVSTLLQK